MKLTWYGHSCFKLETAEGSVVFDPYSPGSVPGLSLPELTADVTICSHGHGDHNYTAGVRRSGAETSFRAQQIELFHDDVHGLKRGKNRAAIVDAEGQRLVHLGDLGHALDADTIAALGKVDVLLIPVGGYYTIDAAQAHGIVTALKPRITVPMHYRGAGFGYAEIATVDEFLSLSANVRRFDENTLEITPATESMTAVLRCPV